MTTDPKTLQHWLDHAQAVHPVGIDLGLERVGRAARRLGFDAPGHRPAPRSVIVAGTNGKGSTCVALEALLRAAGLAVGTTLSPHVHVFNERVRVDGQMLDDEVLAEAFARVDAARDGIPLTYFEFSALVALDSFRRAEVDVAVLEVGLGGRLDAFNLVDADVAVITGIGLDHQAYLGNDVETIGREKAGVMRPGQRVVLGRRVTDSVVQAARELDCRVTRLGAHFHVQQNRTHWDFIAPQGAVEDLAVGALAPDNCALALEAARHLTGLPEPEARSALTAATLPGRMEAWRVGAEGRLLLLDVAHNPDAARFLAEQLALRHPERRFVAILGTLEDKDSAGVVAALSASVRAWLYVPTRGPRGLSARALADRTAAAARGPTAMVGDPAQGLDRALSLCDAGDAILAFGSFDLVEQMRETLMAGHLGARPAAATGRMTAEAPD